MPHELPSLFDAVFDTIEASVLNNVYVRLSIGYLVCAVQGLSSVELEDLLLTNAEAG